MATPKPTSDTKNCTMNETSVNVVMSSRIRNVERIETAAMKSGKNASSDANTNNKTARAPTPASKVSTNTPGPSALTQSYRRPTH